MRNIRLAPRGIVAAFVFALLAFLAVAPANAQGPYGGGSMYTFQYGDSLPALANRYGTSLQAIMQANRMTSPYAYVGRSLYIPGGYTSQTYNSNAYRATSVYIVQPGDTLFGIARRFGVSQSTLASINHLFNPNLIFAGMRLVIPHPSPVPPYPTYVVQPGDTLFRIALRYGTTVYALMIANNIPNPNLIFVGMRLVIPGGATYSNPSASNYATPGAPIPSTGGTPYPTAAPTTSMPSMNMTPAPVNTITISIKNLAFNPPTLTVHVGTMVMWTNDETSAISHTVTSGTPNAPSGIFDSGTLNQGQSFQFTFNTAGNFPYFCRIHGAAMMGIINVVP